MSGKTRFLNLLRTAMASAIALSVAAPGRVEAQSDAAAAYRQAKSAGTVEALERFIESYPTSEEAGAAFVDIVSLTRGSTIDSRPDTSGSRGIIYRGSERDDAPNEFGSENRESSDDPY